MRTGLVLVGIGMAVIGAGVIASLALAPDPGTIRESWPIDIENLTSNASRGLPVPGTTGTGAIFSFDWVSSSPAEASLWPAVSCGAASGACPTTELPVVHWNATTHGDWSTHGVLPSYYLLTIWAPASSSVNFTGQAAESYAAPSLAIATWAMISVIVGGVVLLGIGAMALFLGLFLRPSIYQPPPPSAGGSEPFDETDEFDDEPPEPPNPS